MQCHPPLKELVGTGVRRYVEIYKSNPEYATFAPGRVNLIGEHTDYNDGFVLPMAIPLVTVIIGGKSHDNKCKIFTTCSEVDDPKLVEFSLESILTLTPGYPKWANYIKGVLAFHQSKEEVPPFNVLVTSSVTCGGGLSSSAALEVAMYTFIDCLLGINDKTVEYMKAKALTCQKAEHVFANVPCGIMDQMVSTLALEGHAMLIDCRSFDIKLVAFPCDKVSILITNSNVKHELSSGEYALRKQQCEKAALLMNVSKLRDLSIDTLNDSKDLIDDVCYKRARHVISENNRCLQASIALQNNQFEELGKLMTESHYSLKNDYEVSCDELDELVNLALQIDGVYGSRMTGGGFGGCTVTLLNIEIVESVIKHIQMNYTGNANFYLCKPFNGAQEIAFQTLK